MDQEDSYPFLLVKGTPELRPNLLQYITHLHYTNPNGFSLIPRCLNGGCSHMESPPANDRVPHVIPSYATGSISNTYFQIKYNVRDFDGTQVSE